MQQPQTLGEGPDETSRLWLRTELNKRRAENVRVGEIAAEVGVNEMTLRKFLDHEDRKPYPETWNRYRAWYARRMGASDSETVAAKAEKALLLMQESQSLLAEVARALANPVAVARQAAEAVRAGMPPGGESPRPENTPASPNTAPTRGGTRTGGNRGGRR